MSNVTGWSSARPILGQSQRGSKPSSRRRSIQLLTAPTETSGLHIFSRTFQLFSVFTYTAPYFRGFPLFPVKYHIFGFTINVSYLNRAIFSLNRRFRWIQYQWISKSGFNEFISSSSDHLFFLERSNFPGFYQCFVEIKLDLIGKKWSGYLSYQHFTYICKLRKAFE